MKNNTKKILIVGLFLSEKNKEKINRSAADQLAELLEKNGYSLIKVSDKVSKLSRLFDTILTIILKSSQYKIAIVPFYGTFFSYWWSYIACFLLKILDKKIVLIIHGGSIPAQLQTNAVRYLNVINKASIVVCPSPFIQTALNNHNVDSILIENVINLDDYKFHLKEQFRPRILWMRTLHEIYNPEMAVRVAALLSKKYPDLKMVIAGRDDGALQQVKALATQLQVQHLIEFPGTFIRTKKINTPPTLTFIFAQIVLIMRRFH